VDAFKKTRLMVFGVAMQTYGEKLTDEQEVLMHLADIAIDVFSAESATLRRPRRLRQPTGQSGLPRRRGTDVRQRRRPAHRRLARQALAAMAEGDTLRTMLAALRRLLKVTPVNTVGHAAASRGRDRRARCVPVRLGRMGWTGRMGWMGRMGWIGRIGRYGGAQRVRVPALPALPALLLICLAISCSAPKPPDDRDYATRIAADRAAKDEAFMAGDDPIPKAKHAEFLPLAYYPVDPEFNVPAELKRIDDPTIIEMPTSTGTNRKMRRVGTLHFHLEGSTAVAARVHRARRNLESLRRVQRPDERRRDLRRRTVPRHQPERHRPLRARFQPRVLSVLLLQPDLRVSAPAARESPEDSDPCRRTHAEV
jgi:hypothetical protein